MWTPSKSLQPVLLALLVLVALSAQTSSAFGKLEGVKKVASPKIVRPSKKVSRALSRFLHDTKCMEYMDTFLSLGYETVGDIARATDADLKEEVGILLASQRRRLLFHARLRTNQPMIPKWVLIFGFAELALLVLLLIVVLSFPYTRQALVELVATTALIMWFAIRQATGTTLTAMEEDATYGNTQTAPVGQTDRDEAIEEEGYEVVRAAAAPDAAAEGKEKGVRKRRFFWQKKKEKKDKKEEATREGPKK